MSSKIFIDSSLLIEYNKGTRQNLLVSILADELLEGLINETVVSEFLFHFLKLNGNASPLSLKSSNKIPAIIAQSEDYKLLTLFHLITNDIRVIKLVPEFMQRYNLLPNDAIILATCKLHGITQLASHDIDFIGPCKSEGITLLREE